MNATGLPTSLGWCEFSNVQNSAYHLLRAVLVLAFISLLFEAQTLPKYSLSSVGYNL